MTSVFSDVSACDFAKGRGGRKSPTLKIKGILFSFYISIKYISCMHIHMFSPASFGFNCHMSS